MIVDGALWLFDVIMDGLMLLLDALPTFPPDVVDVIDTVFGWLYSAVGMVDIFIPISIVRLLIPILIAVLNMDRIVKLIVFLIKKIPFLGME